ncbi:MAG: histone deacetylase family protein [Pseudomonadota bacterium]
MLSIYSDRHKLRDAQTELDGGRLITPFECPIRAETVLARVKQVKLGPVTHPQPFGLEPILRVHDKAYVTFMQRIWHDWVKAGHQGEAIPNIWPSRRAGRLKIPHDVQGQLGYYAMAGETAISNGTWEAACSAVDVAMTGVSALVEDNARAAFAMCRPPGHHAGSDVFGGYCFFNNAAIAAQALLDRGAGRVAILDVDFHHGNGTQQIFYNRDDVLFLSIHGDPADAFPHFLGFQDEIGTGKGEGMNANYPLPSGTDFDRWRDALASAMARIHHYSPDALVVSLGVDTFKDDPISFFKLESDDFKRYGAMIAEFKGPVLFVMEGGYAVAELGINVVNVLEGFGEQ